MTPTDLDSAHEAGMRRVKFIYPMATKRAMELRKHAASLGWSVIVHSGGMSTAATTTWTRADIEQLAPDMLGHLNGGPTAPGAGDVDRLIGSHPTAIELVKNGNPAVALHVADLIAERGDWTRLILGTDSPSGCGIVPCGLWQLIAMLSSVGGHPPATLLCCACGTTAKWYLSEPHTVEAGTRGTLLVVDAPEGGSAEDALGSLARGDIPGVAARIEKGLVAQTEGFLTPPAKRATTLHGGPNP